MKYKLGVCMGKGKVLLLAVSIALGACSVENKVKQASAVATASSAVAVASAVPALKKYDGPFGLEMGVSYSELVDTYDIKPAGADSIVLEGVPPSPSDLFESYMFVAGKKTGLCKVIAYSKAVEFNDRGDQIKHEVGVIAEALAVKYGTGKKEDLLRAAYREIPEAWAMGNKKKDVYYGYAWKSSPNFPSYLSSIDVSAESVSSYSGMVKVIYSFKNFEECRKESVQKKSSNL